MLPVPEIAKSDPFWLKEDPHRTAYAQQTLLGPTLPIYEVFNPAMAQVNTEHLFSVAMFDVIKDGMASEAAIDKAFKRVEAIFAKYPIQEGESGYFEHVSAVQTLSELAPSRRGSCHLRDADTWRAPIRSGAGAV